MYNYEKITQLLNFFARKNSNSRIQKLKAIKLIWAADRYHLRKYGRLVSDDMYIAMNFGPVGSVTKNLAEEDTFYLTEKEVEYANHFISHDGKKYVVTSHEDVDTNKFSRTDLEALEFAWSQFGHYDGFEIADISHEYPEWKKFEDVISTGYKKSAPINVADFFEDPDELTLLPNDPFELPAALVSSSKEVFCETA